MDLSELKRFTDRAWDDSIVPTLQTYIAIPNKSPNFDQDWQTRGHMDRAVELAANWCRSQPIRGLAVEIMRLPGRTPLLVAEIPGNGKDTVLLYGHLDKQPEFTGWLEGLEPWVPVMRGDKLYGRGGADDGYATFASLTAIRALQEQGAPHARCIMLIECCEECGNYDQLWTTTSLRGNLVGTLTVEVLTEGVHSGAASGIVPSSFRVLRALLDRVEDSATGNSRVKSLKPKIPAQRMAQIKRVAKVLKNTVFTKMPFAKGVQPLSKDTVKLIVNNTWGPTLSVTGVDGIPTLGNAGNVLRPKTTVKLSFRLPPTADARKVGAEVKKILEAKPPYGARVQFAVDSAMGGWNAAPVAPWLEQSMQRASKTHFGRDAVYMGTGGSIPFMGMLGKKFPKAQFLVTGLLGPHSNAHGPNEFLHIPTGKKLTACVAQVLEDHCRRK